MFTIDEMPQKQVAERWDCSVEAVKWHCVPGTKEIERDVEGRFVKADCGLLSVLLERFQQSTFNNPQST
jgi:hypothetical protein